MYEKITEFIPKFNEEIKCRHKIFANSPVVWALKHNFWDLECDIPDFDSYKIFKNNNLNFWSDVSSLDGKTIMAMFDVLFRRCRFVGDENLLQELLTDGTINRWLLRLKKIDEESS